MSCIRLRAKDRILITHPFILVHLEQNLDKFTLLSRINSWESLNQLIILREVCAKDNFAFINFAFVGASGEF